MRFSMFVLIVICAIFLFAEMNPVHAQVVGGGKKGAFANHQPFAESAQEAFEEARERQCPVILCIPATC